MHIHVQQQFHLECTCSVPQYSAIPWSLQEHPTISSMKNSPWTPLVYSLFTNKMDMNVLLLIETSTKRKYCVISSMMCPRLIVMQWAQSSSECDRDALIASIVDISG